MTHARATPATACIDGTQGHYWKIVTLEGPESPGICQRCDAKRWFRNALPEFSEWEHLSPERQARLEQFRANARKGGLAQRAAAARKREARHPWKGAA